MLSFSKRLVVSSGQFLTRRLSSSQAFKLVNLKNTRSLLKLEGPDTLSLLQGLVTNDVGQLSTSGPPSCIYALFLNHQGRVLWDTVVYQEKEVTWLEVDHRIKDKVVKHLKQFRLRKKVTIDEEVTKDLWVGFKDKEEDSEEPPGTSWQSFRDPRLKELGWRLLVTKDQKIDEKVTTEVEEYTRLRYKLGVAEGIQEIPSGSSFPLESNGDFLQGISFHKGCYIGQELTARTHHTGVVRKRIMPFRLEGNGDDLSKVEPETLEVVNKVTNKVVGKVRGLQGDFGIGLIRVQEALGAEPGQLRVGEVTITVTRPDWWPRDRERSSS